MHIVLVLHFSSVELHTSYIKEFYQSLEMLFLLYIYMCVCMYIYICVCMSVCLWMHGFSKRHALRHCLIVFATWNTLTYVNFSSLFVKMGYLNIQFIFSCLIAELHPC